MTEFGVLCFSGAMGRGSRDEGVSYDMARRLAAAAEQFGYDTFLLPDELFITVSPLVECWTALAALACETSAIKIGPYITCNSYRHPGLLAKMGATVDVISKGRLQFYLGACGWGQEVVHTAYGLAYGRLSERVDMLKEAIQVIRALWSQERVSFEGEYYSLHDAICEPKPVQNPLEIRTGGSSDRLIEAAAAVADGWDGGFCTLDGFIRMSETLDRACERLGRNPKEVKRSMHWHTTLIGRDKAEVEDKKERFVGPILEAKSRHPTRWIRELPVDEYIDRRFLMGTPSECAAKLSGFIEHGCDRLNFVFPDASEIEPIKIFAEGVISRFK